MPANDQYVKYHRNVRNFIKKVLCEQTNLAQDIYVPGSRRVRFYASALRSADAVSIVDPKNQAPELAYEEVVYDEILQRENFSLLVLIGGLGAGKSTTALHIRQRLISESEKTRELFACNCTTCFRQPLYVDCSDIDADLTLNEAFTVIYRKIRHLVISELVDCWRARSLGRRPERPVATAQILRRLILANDFSRWAETEWDGAFDFSFDRADCRYSENILELDYTDELRGTLAKKYREPTDRLGETLHAHRRKPDFTRHFTSAILAFYLSSCPAENAQNTLIVDNLDQLPTDYIETIVRALHAMTAKKKSVLQLVVPLRPSSIAPPQGFTSLLNLMFHYGPSSFDMILRRLERHVLRRSLQDLAHVLPKARAHRGQIFLRRPDVAETKVFVMACYLLARIMAVGRRGLERVDRPIELHEDHQYLDEWEFNEESAVALARIFNAMVGTCARYAIEHLERFLGNLYHQGRILQRMAETRRLSVPYKALLSVLIFDRYGEIVSDKFVNLYQPTTTARDSRMPSLVKLRILLFLQNKGRALVRDVANHLSLYGVPWSVTIHALNALHIRENTLLLWFSKNRDLKVRTEHLKEYVVISEHGLAYLEELIGNFEYLWVCGAQLAGVSPRMESFPARLGHFYEFMTAVAETEWKQICYRKCHRTEMTHEEDYQPSEEMIVLRILYNSLSAVLESAAAAINKAKRDRRHSAGEKQTYIGDVQSLVTRLARLTRKWQRRYRMAFNGPGYLAKYEEELKALREPVGRASRSDAVDEEGQEELVALHGTWAASKTERTVDVVPSVEPEPLGVPTLLRSLFPGVNKRLEKLDVDASLVQFIERYAVTRSQLQRVLEDTVPPIRDVEHRLHVALSDVGVVVECFERLGPAIQPTYAMFMKEETWLRERLRVLQEYLIKSPRPVRRDAMDKRKEAFNNQMLNLQAMASRLSPKRPAHLEVTWTS